MPFNETQQAFTQNLKNHANVRAIGPCVAKVVQERDDMRSPRMVEGPIWRAGRYESLQQLDFVQRSLGVARRRLDDLQRNMAFHPVFAASSTQFPARPRKTNAHLLSHVSHTVEKWPQPSLRTTT